MPRRSRILSGEANLNADVKMHPVEIIQKNVRLATEADVAEHDAGRGDEAEGVRDSVGLAGPVPDRARENASRSVQ